MQLFTIGLWKLNEDGTRVQESGRDVPTYSNEHIMNFARVFTGPSGNKGLLDSAIPAMHFIQ